MNFLKKGRVAIDQPWREARVVSWVERGLCFTASARIGLGSAARVPETQYTRWISISWASVRPKGQDIPLHRREVCA